MTELHLVSQVGLATYGFDQVSISCIQILRKTNSLALHYQMCGRGLRLFPARHGVRPYQSILFDDVMSDPRSVVAVAPCGSGKSYLVADIIKELLRQGRRPTYLVDRRALVHDIIGRLNDRGIEHGVHMPPFKPNPSAAVQVASTATVLARDVSTGGDVLIIDECHLAVTESFDRVLELHPNAWRCGLTATPIRLSGEGLGRLFDRMVMGPTTESMIADGWLCPYRAFAPKSPDLSSAKTTGDYNQIIAGRLLSRPGVVGDAVAMWKKHGVDRNGEPRRTLLFSPTIEASQKYVEMFCAAGVAAAHLDSNSSDEERKDVWGRLALNAPPKEDCLYLDHVGNLTDLGLPDDAVGWSLDDSCPVRRKSDDDPSLSGRHCEKCLFFFRSILDTCPECGATRIKTQRQIAKARGELEEIQRQRKADAIANAVKRMDPSSKYAELKALGVEKGYAPGWAKMRYKLMFGRWPSN